MESRTENLEKKVERQIATVATTTEIFSWKDGKSSTYQHQVYYHNPSTGPAASEEELIEWQDGIDTCGRPKRHADSMRVEAPRGTDARQQIAHTMNIPCLGPMGLFSGR